MQCALISICLHESGHLSTSIVPGRKPRYRRCPSTHSVREAVASRPCTRAKCAMGSVAVRESKLSRRKDLSSDCTRIPTEARLSPGCWPMTVGKSLPENWRRRSDSNRRSGLCRPVPYHLATPPSAARGPRGLSPLDRPLAISRLPSASGRTGRRLPRNRGHRRLDARAARITPRRPRPRGGEPSGYRACRLASISLALFPTLVASGGLLG